MRRGTVVLLAGAVALAAPAVVALPAAAASGTVARVVVTLADPLMVNPVEVEVDALDADGNPVGFSGSVMLRTGRTSTTVHVADPDGSAIAVLDTTRLSGGSATATARITGATGGARTVTVRQLIDVPPSFRVAGLGCTAIRSAGGSMSWRVTWLNGEPIRTPASSEWVQLPQYYRLTDHPTSMVDGNGSPLRTHGTVTVRSRSRTVATLRLGTAVRRLVFRTAWNGRVAGRFRPGTYTATLKITDAYGRVSTASQPVHVVRSGTLPCI